MTQDNITLFATAAFGMEGIVAAELKRLNMNNVKAEMGGARFTGCAVPTGC